MAVEVEEIPYSVLRYNSDVPLNLRKHSTVADRYSRTGALLALADLPDDVAAMLHVEDRIEVIETETEEEEEEED